MFRTSVVHLQERSYAVCCNSVCLDTLWGWRKNCSPSFTLITTWRIETYRIATYSIRTLLRMDYYSPEHVELLNVMNKINQVFCILLDYRCITKWYTVHTISNVIYIYIYPIWFCIQPEDGFCSRNMSLMINYKQSCVWASFMFILFTNTHSVSVIKCSQLMLYRKISSVCSEIRTQHMNTLCGPECRIFLCYAWRCM